MVNMKFNNKTMSALSTLLLYNKVSDGKESELELLKDIVTSGYADEAQEEDLYDLCVKSIKSCGKDIKAELNAKDGVDIDSVDTFMKLQKLYFRVLKYILKHSKTL